MHWRRTFERATTAIVMMAACFQCVAAAAVERGFDFTYATSLTGLPPGKRARIWLPMPPSTAAQKVVRLRATPPMPDAPPPDPFGNTALYYDLPAGPDGSLQFSVTYRITRHEVAAQPAGENNDADFLKPDRLVPVGGHPATLLDGLDLPADPVRLARRLYDLVDDRMQYRKDQPGWGRGDAAWACDSRFGNCTDFHSLFISLARTKAVPAKFEIGFSVPDDDKPADVAGYHCWAFFKAGTDWVPVDISEANKHPDRRDYYFGHLDANRVTFTTGRDLVLNPPQAGPPLNFFIYPYAEVDGKPVPTEQIKRSFHVDPVKP